MAEKAYSFTYILDENGTIITTGAPGPRITSEQDTVSPGDDVTLELGSTTESASYYGYNGGDVFVSVTDGSGNVQRYLLSNTAYAGGDTPEVTTGDYVVCFLAGTMIATPTGNVAIETLAAGDLVLTADGTARPVHWLARQTISTMFADPLKVMPVRIRAGALGANLPARDLYVSADHALEIDGLLVQAGALVNGSSIVRHTDMPETFVYFHVELEGHALILAEGVAAETFVDNVTRRRFDNYAEYEALYGDGAATITELELPRVKSARQLPAAIRSRIAGLAQHDTTAAA